MKKKSILRGVGFLLTLLLLNSCSDTKNSDVTAIPFKHDEDGKWGMMTTQGEVVFENEFRNCPTYVTDERFFVQNQDGFWEMYSAEPTPTRYGEEMRYASVFSCGAAMVTPRNSPITIINKKGEKVKELETFENKPVKKATAFVGANSVVTCDSLDGVINVKGETVLPPKYRDIRLLNNGLIIASDNDYQATHFDYYDSIPRKGRQIIMDSKGKELFSMDGSKHWSIVEGGVTDKYITLCDCVVTKKTEKINGKTESYPEIKWVYSIVDYEGKNVYTAKDEVYDILAIRGEEFIFNNEDLLTGVMSIEGKVIVKPEYNGINFIGESYLAVRKYSEGESEVSFSFRLLDNSGQPATNLSFTGIADNDTYRNLEGNNIIASEEGHNWVILNDKMERLPNLPKIYDMLPYSSGDEILYTDKIDYAKFIEDLKITPTSMGAFNFSMSPQKAIEEEMKAYSWDDAPQGRPKPADYTWRKSVTIYGDVDGLSYTGDVNFPQTLSKQTFTQKQVIDYVWGNRYWYHNENVPTGYVFNKITPSSFILHFSHYIYYGKLRDLYKELVAYCKKWGTMEDSNSGATLIDLKDGKKLLITLSSEEVKMEWGNLPQDALWIGQYQGNAEKLESTYSGNEYYIDFVNVCNNCEEEGI